MGKSWLNSGLLRGAIQWRGSMVALHLGDEGALRLQELDQRIAPRQAGQRVARTGAPKAAEHSQDSLPGGPLPSSSTIDARSSSDTSATPRPSMQTPIGQCSPEATARVSPERLSDRTLPRAIPRPRSPASRRWRQGHSRNRRAAIRLRRGRRNRRSTRRVRLADAQPSTRCPAASKTSSRPPASPTATRPPGLAQSAVTGASNVAQISDAPPHSLSASTCAPELTSSRPSAVHAQRVGRFDRHAGGFVQPAVRAERSLQRHRRRFLPSGPEERHHRPLPQ